LENDWRLIDQQKPNDTTRQQTNLVRCLSYLPSPTTMEQTCTFARCVKDDGTAGRCFIVETEGGTGRAGSVSVGTYRTHGRTWARFVIDPPGGEAAAAAAAAAAIGGGSIRFSDDPGIVGPKGCDAVARYLSTSGGTGIVIVCPCCEGGPDCTDDCRSIDRTTTTGSLGSLDGRKEAIQGSEGGSIAGGCCCCCCCWPLVMCACRGQQQDVFLLRFLWFERRLSAVVVRCLHRSVGR
jgi:hypothetical protein